MIRRENTYKVMTASNPPADTKAAGINQDGTDYSYFVQVELGSKKQKMYMLVDTGAGSSWVMSSTCKSAACLKHNSFGAETSDTNEMSGGDFSIAYGSGNVKGKLTRDTVAVAGMSFKYQFGLASETSTDFEHFAFDGILGLSMGKGASENFLETLSKANQISQNTFAISLNRASDGANNGEIKFGGVNPSKYSGDIKYTAVGSATGDWAIPMDDMSFDGKKAGNGGVLAYIDTGTSFIFASSEMVKKLHAIIPGAQSGDGVTYNVPCDTTKSISLTFSGVDYQIQAKDWVSPKDNAGKCTSNIYGHEVVKNAWLMGDTFLKNVYAVFDKDKKQIGFAAAPNSAPTPAKSVSTPGPDSNTPSTFSTGITPAPPSGVPNSKPGMGLSGYETVVKSGGTAVETALPSKTGGAENSAFGLHARSIVASTCAGAAAVTVGLLLLL